MPAPEHHPDGDPDDHRGQATDGLLRALSALHLSQSRWLEDAGEVCRGEHAFATSFRRWEEQLTMVKLQLHRVENRLLHFLLVPQPRAPWRAEAAAPVPGAADPRAVHRDWRERFAQWFQRIHLDTAYRRIDNVIDPDQEAITADIVTDLATLAELTALTSPALVELSRSRDPTGLDQAAFYRVLAPWRRNGIPALHDVLRWLSETLGDQDAW